MEWKNRWSATVASIWIQCTSGSLYTFGVYSPLLKSTQHYTQSTLDTIATFKDIGGNVGLLAGLLYTAVTPNHFHSSSSSSSSSSCWSSRSSKVGGPWLVLAAGAIQCFTGYFLLWLSVTGRISRPPVPLMCLYMFIAAHAQTFFNTANVVTAVLNFPRRSGTIVGIMKGFVGLSGAILIQLNKTIFDEPGSFILMLALLATLNPLLLMFFVRVYPPNGHGDNKFLNSFSVITLILAAYLMLLIILETNLTLGLLARLFSLAILLLALASPICILIRANSMVFSQTSSIEEDALLSNGQGSSELGNTIVGDYDQEKEPSSVAVGRDLNLLQSMWTLDFWLLVTSVACGMGSGLSTVNNISQIGESLGYKSVETSALVSLWSIWNFLGRIGAGFISDYFLQVRGLSRPLLMAIALGIMSFGHLLVASGLPGSLYAGPILVGLCYGAQWSLMPTICSEIFSVLHMGTIFYTVSIASPVGSYVLSVWVIGYIYDKEASWSSSSGNRCFGSRCFMLSFLIMACVSMLGSFIALALSFRTKRFYNQLRSSLNSAATI